MLAGILTNQYRTHSSVLRALEREMKAEDDAARAYIRRKLYAMRQLEYVSKRDNTLLLTRTGRNVLSEDKDIFSLTIPVPKKHDGLWRILVFDIPQEQARARIEFVRHLRRLGLVFYQRSVWVHPYPFEKEVKKIARKCDVLRYTLFITANTLDGMAVLRRKFKLDA
ncbi:hypothetical protein COU20_04115 [Candidatus Kaiserbacteria bacterium CG10_big_fil_rev_8_21_14_0_10_59_10]|uniref:Transcriptional repressor PaaX-like central Cas2-like domain-containing protein n=1 Tax=Candidatus Kaiserbacteria bacterium CG10_big_fil_rev_8_21_14_0_10_59_10 TaxID=1974612 RepID=A0A2H0U6S3_9BACT|nr:MAG: hypothetical protein COU20_04115 [Candidatus Kaiserbacteria bacterium CG10_big_fil_rev_8_21_14_0_10_59_10]